MTKRSEEGALAGARPSLLLENDMTTEGGGRSLD